jgi:hypothetical protein
MSPLERYLLIRAVELSNSHNDFSYERQRVLAALRDRLIGESHDEWKKANDS